MAKAGGLRQAYRDGSWDDVIGELVLTEEAQTSSGHYMPAPGEGLTPLTEA